jgi:hypothetical protein
VARFDVVPGTDGTEGPGDLASPRWGDETGKGTRVVGSVVQGLKAPGYYRWPRSGRGNQVTGARAGSGSGRLFRQGKRSAGESRQNTGSTRKIDTCRRVKVGVPIIQPSPRNMQIFKKLCPKNGVPIIQPSPRKCLACKEVSAGDSKKGGEMRRAHPRH